MADEKVLTDDSRPPSESPEGSPGTTPLTPDGTPTPIPGFEGLSPEAQALLTTLLGDGTDATGKKVDPNVTRGTAVYVQIWGMEPPKGYIKGLVEAGMNSDEIAAHELSKEGPNGGILAKKTQYWRDQQANMALALARLMGFR